MPTTPEPPEPLEERLARLARSPGTPILVTGEFGTGRRRMARRVHDMGSHPDASFRALDVSRFTPTHLASLLFGHEEGAFTEARDRQDGLLHEARGGTLVLEEVTALAEELQPRLARVLQEGVYTRLGGEAELACRVRIVATARAGYPEELASWVTSGRLHADLVDALRPGWIHLSPVRNLGDADRRRLLASVLDEVATGFPGVPPRFHSDTLEILLRYPWPGNVREVRNVLERALMAALPPVATSADVRGPRAAPSAGVLHPRHLPRDLLAPARERGAERRRGFRPESMEEVERRHIWLMLRHHGGNRSRTARDLGMARTTLLQKIARYGLEDAGR